MTRARFLTSLPWVLKFLPDIKRSRLRPPPPPLPPRQLLVPSRCLPPLLFCHAARPEPAAAEQPHATCTLSGFSPPAGPHGPQACVWAANRGRGAGPHGPQAYVWAANRVRGAGYGNSVKCRHCFYRANPRLLTSGHAAAVSTSASPMTQCVAVKQCHIKI